MTVIEITQRTWLMALTASTLAFNLANCLNINKTKSKLPSTNITR